jgi:hypothetical protein
MLAMALLLERYLKQSLSDDDRQKIEAKWLCMWKEKLGQPQRSPTQVMKAYCSTLNITLEHLDLVMDWECWPVDEYGNFAVMQGFNEFPK